MNHIDANSATLVCLDSISGKLTIPTLPVKGHTLEQLLCLFWDHLANHKNVIEIGKYSSSDIIGFFCQFLFQVHKVMAQNCYQYYHIYH
jgi:hypothetical protein